MVMSCLASRLAPRVPAHASIMHFCLPRRQRTSTVRHEARRTWAATPTVRTTQSLLCVMPAARRAPSLPMPPHSPAPADHTGHHHKVRADIVRDRRAGGTAEEVAAANPHLAKLLVPQEVHHMTGASSRQRLWVG
jgi:hypothetical protein